MHTATAPGITPSQPRASYVLARRGNDAGNLRSTFAAVIDPFNHADKQAIIKSISDAHGNPDLPDWPIMLAIDLGDGNVDYILAGKGFAKISTKGGRAQSVALIGATEVTYKGSKISLPAPSFTGRITRIDEQKQILYTSEHLVTDSKLTGEFVSIGNKAYSHRSSYRIASVSYDQGMTAIKLAPTSFVIGRAHLDTMPPDDTTLPNVIPLEYAKSVGRKASGFYNGKTIATPDGSARTTITDILAPDGETIKVESSTGFKASDDAIIYDIQPGDDLLIPRWTIATQNDSGKWNYTGQ